MTRITQKKELLPFHELPHVVSYNDTAAQQKNQYISPETQRSLSTLNQHIAWLDLLKQSEKPAMVDVGDMSRKKGEAYGSHHLHRTGASVDMRPQKATYDHRAVGDFRHNRNYSPEKTQRLVELLRHDPNLKTIYFNDPRIRGVTPAKGHFNHLHVEFKK